jgi:heme/copper-type cytochrome/quinol oxidase subunit 2
MVPAQDEGTAVSPLGAVIRRGVATVAIVAVLGSATVLACPVCFGADETALIDGSRLGVLVLLAITLVVQGSFAAFFLYLRRRAKRTADADLDEEWSELQKSPGTS